MYERSVEKQFCFWRMAVALEITLMIDLNGKSVIGPFSNYG